MASNSSSYDLSVHQALLDQILEDDGRFGAVDGGRGAEGVCGVAFLIGVAMDDALLVEGINQEIEGRGSSVCEEFTGEGIKWDLEDFSDGEDDFTPRHRLMNLAIKTKETELKFFGFRNVGLDPGAFRRRIGSRSGSGNNLHQRHAHFEDFRCSHGIGGSEFT